MMRPHTPSLDTAHVAAAGPTSPPETPTTGSPKIHRKAAAKKLNGRHSRHSKSHNHQGHPPNIRPLGGTKFSYTRNPRPEEISPRSSHSDDESDSSSASSPQSPLSDLLKPHQQHIEEPVITIQTVVSMEHATFSIEELDDDCWLNGECDHLDVIRPHDFEYAGSDRSRSMSRPPPDMDPAVMEGIENLNTFEDSDVDFDHDDEEFRRQLQKRREERRLRRMKSGSLSKRTVSERGSDSDREDILPYHDGNDPGPTRRIRRKVGDRTSIQFSGPLPEPIEELKEPNSDDEIILENADVFAKELPYWTLMEVDSE
ncbi:hypothetical protein M426DRAFT_207659 [Hypoxylon sp. CI-4A]|nr:hypothetical protein M426DRAFT_207659 [Hypoxylon sp. CI-4A]